MMTLAFDFSDYGVHIDKLQFKTSLHIFTIPYIASKCEVILSQIPLFRQ